MNDTGRRTPVSRWLLPASGVVLSVVAGWVAVQGVDLARVGDLLGGLDLRFLALAIGLVGIELIVRAWRWSLLLPGGPSGRPSTGRLVPIALVGYLGNTVLPARIGDAAMAVLVGRREHIAIAGALGSVVLMRVVDTLVLAVLIFPAAIIAGVPIGFVGAAAVAAAGAATVLLVAQTAIPGAVIGFARRRVQWPAAAAFLDHAARFLDAMNAKGRERAFAAAIGLTVGIWTLEATVYWLSSVALGVGLSPAAALIVDGVAVLGTAVPAAPGYVGTFELAASSVARALGAEPSAALAFAILVHAVTAIPLALGGVVAMAWLGLGLGAFRRPASAEADPTSPAVGASRS